MNRKCLNVPILRIAVIAILFALLFVFTKTQLFTNELENDDAKMNTSLIKRAINNGWVLNEAAILSSCSCDLDRDSSDELVLLLRTPGSCFGDKLIILSTQEGLKEFYSGSFKELNPWKVESCDIDGDGEKELALGVYTVAKFHPVYAKRLFLYNFSQHDLYPKWLGSRLSRPFEDYVFADMDNDNSDELISIEIDQTKNKELNIYKWKGFGFESLGTSKAYDDIKDLALSNRTITAKIKEGLLWGVKSFQFAPEENNVLDAF